MLSMNNIVNKVLYVWHITLNLDQTAIFAMLNYALYTGIRDFFLNNVLYIYM